MAATFESLDLLGTDLAHPRPRPRFAGPKAPPPRAIPKPRTEADLDAPVWPGASPEPPPARVEAPWIKVTPPVALERVLAPEPVLELDPDEDVPRGPITLVPFDEADEDDVAADLLELEAPDDDDLVAIVEPMIVEAVASWAPRTTGRRIAPGCALLGPRPPRGAGFLTPREDDRSQQPLADDFQPPVAEDFNAFESEWFAEEPVIVEPRRVAWWEVILPVSAGLAATSLLATVIAIARAWG